MKSFEFLEEEKIKFNVVHFKEIALTAKDVERIYGCSLHQVLKTLIFTNSRGAVAAVLPGDKKVDLVKLKKVSGESNLKLARPDEVKALTGYSIGSVSPFGLGQGIKKVIDISAFEIKKVNMGSGREEMGIELDCEELKKVWNGLIGDIIK